MRRASIREPLVIYAVVLALVMSLAVLAFAGLALSRAARRAYARAVRQELALFARTGLLPRGTHPDAEVELGLVSTASSALGLDLAEVRRLARGEAERTSVVVLPLEVPDDEVYLVARLPSAIPSAIALSELSRIMPPVLVIALVAAGVMALLVYRQLLPSLEALREVAGEPRLSPEGLARPDAPNEIVEIAERFRDTTRELRTARERAEAQRDRLERMQASLVRASKLASVGRLAAGIAHEVGNPLAAVKGYLSLMQAGLPEADREQALTRSIRELDRIHATIKKLLTYARTGAELQVEARPFSLRAPVDEALGLARGHPALRGITLEDSVPRDGLEGMGVESHVAQVLMNLLLNAGHALASRPPGTTGPTVGRIRLTRSVQDGFARIEVADDGPGIAPAHRELVFDPFFTTKAPGEGTGLGLALARAMMEAMGGSLDLDAERGSGATFVVQIALAAAPTGAETAGEPIEGG